MVQTWVLNPRVRGERSANLHTYSRRRQTRQHAGASWKAARAVFFVLALLILFSGFTFMRSFASGSHVEAETAAEVVVYADAGDTLWELAAAYKKDSMDIRQAVHSIMERNHLKTPVLRIGQKIIMPGSILKS